MSDRHLLFEIVDALETEGLDRDEYQLQRVIDVEALEQLVDSVSDDLECPTAVPNQGFKYVEPIDTDQRTPERARA